MTLPTSAATVIYMAKAGVRAAAQLRTRSSDLESAQASLRSERRVVTILHQEAEVAQQQRGDLENALSAQRLLVTEARRDLDQEKATAGRLQGELAASERALAAAVEEAGTAKASMQAQAAELELLSRQVGELRDQGQELAAIRADVETLTAAKLAAERGRENAEAERRDERDLRARSDERCRRAQASFAQATDQLGAVQTATTSLAEATVALPSQVESAFEAARTAFLGELVEPMDALRGHLRRVQHSGRASGKSPARIRVKPPARPSPSPSP